MTKCRRRVAASCSARHFVDLVLKGIGRQVDSVGTSTSLLASLAIHIDVGNSNNTVTGVHEAAAADCTDAQMDACDRAIGNLASLAGLGEYLIGAMEFGVADPSPNQTDPLGWGRLVRAILPKASRLWHEKPWPSSQSAKAGFMELGGGSGAGFQLFCGQRQIASIGGGGGGGAAGMFGVARPEPSVLDNESLGGGGGGGVQLLFPAARDELPWTAHRWRSWTTGGGSGCGSCNPGDTSCQRMIHGIACGVKMDDVSVANASAGQQLAHRWRADVLHPCFRAGKLVVIGGGGGGAGGDSCCKSVPHTGYGFGFSATLMPGRTGKNVNQWLHSKIDCCPDLSPWNVTSLRPGLAEPVSPSLRGSSDRLQQRRAHEPHRRLQKQLALRQHQVAQSNGSFELKYNWPKLPRDRYALKYNPLERFLTKETAVCAGWKHWCCICDFTQATISKLPESERSKVSWFLREHCCKYMHSNAVATGLTIQDATPPRSAAIVWRPHVGWVEISVAASDSYAWRGAYLGPEAPCAETDATPMNVPSQLHAAASILSLPILCTRFVVILTAVWGAALLVTILMVAARHCRWALAQGFSQAQRGTLEYLAMDDVGVKRGTTVVSLARVCKSVICVYFNKSKLHIATCNVQLLSCHESSSQQQLFAL